MFHLGLKREGQRDGPSELRLGPDAGRVRRPRHLFIGGKHNRRVAKQIAVGRDEIEYCRAGRNDRVQPDLAVPRVEILVECGLILRILEANQINIFAVVVQPASKTLGQDDSMRIVDPASRGQIAPVGVQHQDLLLRRPRRPPGNVRASSR